MSKEVRSFEVKLTTKEPFRIGAQKNIMSAIDAPVTTIGGRVVIQGSSLKGALRSSMEEHLIHSYPDDPTAKPCIPSAPNTLSADERKLIERGVYRVGGGCSYSPNPRNRSAGICPACYLLGAQGLVGFVRVPYLYTDTLAEEMYAVRIDRALGVVSEKTNRDFQVMPDGVIFVGQIEVTVKDALKGWELGKSRIVDQEAGIGADDAWLKDDKWDADRIVEELIVERLRGLKILGGFRSKGCGKVQIELTENTQR
jgi:CRISPR/Cas system CSM-associated protein Csm3 (group 7 of RAMP superfamily)